MQRHKHVDELGLFNEKNAKGDTPLHLAVKQDFPEGIEVLAQYDTNLEAKNSLTGDTALLMAVKSSSLETVKTLLDCGASCNTPNPQTGMTPLIFLELHDTGDSDSERMINIFFNR